MWFAEAGKYDVLPLDDRLPMDILSDERPSPFDAEGSYVFYPGTSDLPEHAAPNLRGRWFSIHATVELDEAGGGRADRPRRPLRRPQPLPQGREAVVREQLPRHPAGAAALSPDVVGVGATC